MIKSSFFHIFKLKDYTLWAAFLFLRKLSKEIFGRFSYKMIRMNDLKSTYLGKIDFESAAPRVDVRPVENVLYSFCWINAVKRVHGLRKINHLICLQLSKTFPLIVHSYIFKHTIIYFFWFLFWKIKFCLMIGSTKIKLPTIWSW